MLNTHISRYVALHRSLGRKFREQDRMLRLYTAYAEGFGDRRTKVQRIYDWCHTSSSQNVAQRRFDTVRNFSLFAHAEDSGHQVPPAGVFGRGKRPRPTPTIIEPEQVRAIMGRAVRRQRNETVELLVKEREKSHQLRELVSSQLVEITRLASVNEALRAELALQKAIAEGKVARGAFGRKTEA